MSVNDAVFSQNAVAIDVFYSDGVYETSTETPTVGSWDLFRNLAGAIALFSGASLLTIFELGELLLYVFLSRGWSSPAASLPPPPPPPPAPAPSSSVLNAPRKQSAFNPYEAPSLDNSLPPPLAHSASDPFKLVMAEKRAARRPRVCSFNNDLPAFATDAYGAGAYVPLANSELRARQIPSRFVSD